jgi:hypothetical protein
VKLNGLKLEDTRETKSLIEISQKKIEMQNKTKQTKKKSLQILKKIQSTNKKNKK